MKYLLAVLSGFTLTLGVFVGGAAFAVAYLTAEEVPVHKPGVEAAMVLPSEVVRVNTIAQDFERVESQPAPQPLPQEEVSEPAPHIDETTTAASFATEAAAPQSNDHANWCTERYRSYRPETNSYTSYGGDTRECVSPFSNDTISSRPFGGSNEEAIYIEASAGAVAAVGYGSVAGHPSTQHIKGCFSRYRSYRPEDNTYQPYGGGPRRQCQ